MSTLLNGKFGKKSLLLCITCAISLMAAACGSNSESDGPCSSDELNTNQGCLTKCDTQSDCAADETCEDKGVSSKICVPSNKTTQDTGTTSGGPDTGSSTSTNDTGGSTGTPDTGGSTGTNDTGSSTGTNDTGSSTGTNDTGTSTGTNDTGGSTGTMDTGGSNPDGGTPTGDLNCSATYTCLGFCGDNDMTCQQNTFNAASQTGQMELNAMLQCLNNKCAMAMDINTCAEQNCSMEIDACFDNPTPNPPYDCGGFLTCLGNCADGDMQCQQTCASNTSSQGQSDYQSLGTCVQNNCGSSMDQATCIRNNCASEYKTCLGCP